MKMTEEIGIERQEDGVMRTVQFKTQAAVTFKLVGTNLVALYKKEGDENIFLVMPAGEMSGKGMTIGEMITDINAFLKRYSEDAEPLNAPNLVQALRDVQMAGSRENIPEYEMNIDFESIQVELKQAFLYLCKKDGGYGAAIEYAFELAVDFRELFPNDAAFFNVDKLSLGLWNTDRKAILERMGIIDVNTYLA